MSNQIVPEIIPDIGKLKDLLAKELPVKCKFKTPLLNRNNLRIIKSLGVEASITVHPKKVVVQNVIYLYIAVSVVLFWPIAVYFLFKTKDAAAFRSSVHDIVFRATRKSSVPQ